MTEASEPGFRGRGGRSARVLAHGGVSARSLVHDERYLYWSDAADGEIVRISKDGGVPLVLAQGQGSPRALVRDGDWLYWMNGRQRQVKENVRHPYGDGFSLVDVWRGGLVRMPRTGGTIEVVADDVANPASVAARGDTVVWTDVGDFTNGRVFRRVGAGETDCIATHQMYPISIAIDETHVVWACHGRKNPERFKNGRIVRASLATLNAPKRPRKVVTKDRSGPNVVVLDEGSVYWTEFGSIEMAFQDGQVVRRTKAGVTEALAVQKALVALALDATHAYFASFRGDVFRVPKGGGEVTWIVEGDEGNCEALVVDDRCVYWAARDARAAGGAIWKMGK